MLKVIEFRKIKNQFLTKLIKRRQNKYTIQKNTKIYRQDIEHVPIKQRRT